MDEALIPAWLLKTLRAAFMVLGRLMPKFMAKKAANMFLKPQKFPTPKREINALEDAEAFTLKCGLAAHRWGDTHQPKVLLVHGWAGRGSQLYAYAKPLVAAGFQVICFDMPAHGNSPGEINHPPKTRDALLAIGEELGELEAIIAHSFGAACSMWALTLGLKTKHMIALSSPTRYVQKYFIDFFRLPTACAAEFEAEISRMMDFPVEKIDIESIMAPHTTESLPPILFIHGREDSEIPLYHAENNIKFLPAKLLVLDDCDHRKALWDPRGVEATLAFIGVQP